MSRFWAGLAGRPDLLEFAPDVDRKGRLVALATAFSESRLEQLLWF